MTRMHDHVNRGRIVLSMVLVIFVCLSSKAGFSADEAGQRDFTLFVRIKGQISVSAENVQEYFRAISDQPEADRASESAGFLRVKVREGIDVFDLAEPASAVINAPVYLERNIHVTRLLGGDLGGKRATIKASEKEPFFKLKKGGLIELVGRQSDIKHRIIEVGFDEEVVARTERVIGIKPFRKRGIELLDHWVCAKEEIRVRMALPEYDEEESQLAVGFWTDHPESGLEEAAYLAEVVGIEQEKVGKNIFIVRAIMPSLGELRNVTPGWYCPYPPKVKVTVSAKLNEKKVVAETFDLRVTRRGWGFAGGVIFLTVVFLFIMRINKGWSPFEENTEADKKWKETYKTGWLKRFLFSPMDIAVTPVGTYSISKAQALFWTFLVAFSCVYVYLLKAKFILIPEQILILLGVSGGTALAARINSVSKAPSVPKEIMKEIRKEAQGRAQVPRLRNMISIGGRINVYKFQVFVFTFITGGIVFVELLKGFNFPQIPETLIILMGLSNTLYLGNEVSVDPFKDVRKEVEEKAKQYEETTDRNTRKTLKKEIKNKLIEFYQTN